MKALRAYSPNYDLRWAARPAPDNDLEGIFVEKKKWSCECKNLRDGENQEEALRHCSRMLGPT